MEPGRLAQSGESLTANQGVAVSSPGPATFFRWNLIMIFFSAILTLPLIQEEQLSVIGDRMVLNTGKLPRRLAQEQCG